MQGAKMCYIVYRSSVCMTIRQEAKLVARWDLGVGTCIQVIHLVFSYCCFLSMENNNVIKYIFVQLK